MAKTGPKGPTKPMDDTNLPLDRAPDCPIVYGLHVVGGPIVYVGMTKNSTARFRAYRSARSCHLNDRLRAWLEANSGHVVFDILHRGADGIEQAEKREISARVGLFNLVHGGIQRWRKNGPKKPWQAGRAYRTPSDWVLMRIAKYETQAEAARAREERDQMVANMSDAERCLFELCIAKDHRSHHAAAKRHQGWIDGCGVAMIRCIRGEQARG